MRPTFRSLFDSQAAYVLGRLRWFGVPDRDRQDVAQEVFERIARHLDELDPARPVRPWILAITCNAARDYHRRAHVRREQLDEAGEVPVTDRAHDQVEAAELVRRLLSTLSYESREVLVLVALEERPVPEVAALLGLGVKACESRLARARVQLGEAFERMRAAERRRLGGGASLGVLAALDLDQLLRVSRAAGDADMRLEVEALRARIAGSLFGPVTAPAATPAATWGGLAFFAIIAIAACVQGLSTPAPMTCPVFEAAAAPPITPTASPAPTVDALAVPPPTGAVAVSSSPEEMPAPAATPTPCARAVASPPSEISEVGMLGLARRALREGAPERARAWLRRHERVYPRGSLAAERDAMLTRLEASK